MVDSYVVEMVKSAKRSGLDDNKARKRLFELVEAGQADGATSAQQRRGCAARESLIYSLVPFVYSICVKYAFTSDLSDAFSSAMEVVTLKIDGWQPELGALTTYLWPDVRGAVLREQNAAAHGGMSKADVSAWLAIRKATNDGMNDVEDIAAATGLSESRVVEVLAASKVVHATSLDTPVEDGSDIRCVDIIAAEGGDKPFAVEDERDTASEMRAAVKRVVKTRRDRIIMRVLLHKMTGKDAAAALGVSAPRVSQLSRTLKKRLQDELAGVIR